MLVFVFVFGHMVLCCESRDLILHVSSLRGPLLCSFIYESLAMPRVPLKLSFLLFYSLLSFLAGLE